MLSLVSAFFDLIPAFIDFVSALTDVNDTLACPELNFDTGYGDGNLVTTEFDIDSGALDDGGYWVHQRESARRWHGRGREGRSRGNTRYKASRTGRRDPWPRAPHDLYYEVRGAVMRPR